MMTDLKITYKLLTVQKEWRSNDFNCCGVGATEIIHTNYMWDGWRLWRPWLRLTNTRTKSEGGNHLYSFEEG